MGMRVSTSSMVLSAWYATTKIRRRGRGERAVDWRTCREKEIALSNLGKSGTSPSLNDVGEGGLALRWRIQPADDLPDKEHDKRNSPCSRHPLARLEHDRAASEHR